MSRAADERGAVAIMAALLLTSLLGVGALVVDVGAVRLERAQLQNGVDAAALAVAKDCAAAGTIYGWLYRQGDGCDTPAALSQPYLDGNADDGAASLDGVSIDRTNHTVTVRAVTRTSSGRATIPLTFARALGIDEGKAAAEATVGYDPWVFAWPLPFPINRCLYDRLTSGGTTFGQPLTLTWKGVTGSCPSVPAGQDGDAEGYGTVETDDKCNPNSTCNDTLDDNLSVEVTLPVFHRSGSTWAFDGMVGFRLTGYRINPGHRYPNDGPCTVDDCISGWFTRTANVDGTPAKTIFLGGTVRVTD
jgi:hypothetical protein